MDAAKFRSWVFARQGLECRKFGSAREALAKAGWQRSVGGVSPYLAIRARSGDGREQVDSLAAQLELFELPSARSCTYVLPADHFALGLAAGRNFSAATEVATARKLGATDAEIDTLKEAVVAALASGPLSPADMKPHLGDKVRSFGEEGKKKGLTTSLPLALSLLQTEGRIRRKPVNGRFDTQRYNYELWDPPVTKRPTDQEAAYELASLFFGWMGAATVKEFREFSLYPAALAKAAVEAAGAVPFEPSGDLLATPPARAEFEAHARQSKPVYTMLGGIDSFLLQRRGAAFWVAEEDAGVMAPSEKGLKRVGDFNELASHGILDRGRLIGLWEFDSDAGVIEWATWTRPDDALLAEIASAEKYVKEELGDARTFSLDSPASRKPKIEGIKALRAQM
jgi:hypothetical protein